MKSLHRFSKPKLDCGLKFNDFGLFNHIIAYFQNGDLQATYLTYRTFLRDFFQMFQNEAVKRADLFRIQIPIKHFV